MMNYMYQPEFKSSLNVPPVPKTTHSLSQIYSIPSKQQFAPQVYYPPSMETYYQPLQYSAATGRSIHRNTPPMVISNPQRFPSSAVASSSEVSSSYLPSYFGAYSADKSTSSGYSDVVSRTSYIPNPYARLPQYNKNPAIQKQPEVSSFNVSDNSITGTIKSDTQVTNNNKFIPNNFIKESKLTPPPSQQKITEERQFFPNTRTYHGRALSMQTQDDYATPPTIQTKRESCSPSKKVTFNLDKNTYTDIEQIEKRLNEQMRIRELEEKTLSMDKEDIDLHRRFDNAINRSEQIINNFFRIGREATQNKKSSNPDQYISTTAPTSANNSALNTPTKKAYNPSRSKSPIKPSLKRTLSFTSSSPQKTTTSSLSTTDPQQRYEVQAQSPLTNQTNKMTNAINIPNNNEISASVTSDVVKQQSYRPQEDLKGSYRQRDDVKPAQPQFEDLQSSIQSSNQMSKVPPYTSYYQSREKLSSSTILPSTKPPQQSQQNSASFTYDENISLSAYQRALTPPPKLLENPSKSVQSSVKNFPVQYQYNQQNASSRQIQSNYQRFLGNTASSSVPPELSKNNNPQNSNRSSLSKGNEITIQKNENKGKQEINPMTRIPNIKNPVPQSPQPHKGVLKYSDGSRYNGFILNDKRNGYGTLMSDNFQVIYQGEWANDTYHGKGKFFNPLAENLQEDYDYTDFDIALSSYWESYEGDFFEGKLDGQGTLMLTNGEKLVGNFKKGRISGKGTFSCAKNQIINGNWEDNRLIQRF